MVRDSGLEQIHFTGPKNDCRWVGEPARYSLRRISLSTFPMEHQAWPLTFPPNHEQCVEAPGGARADYVISPLAMAVLLDGEEDDNEM